MRWYRAATFNRIELVFIGIAPLPLADTSNVKTSWIFHDPGRCECKSVPDVNEILRQRLQLYDSTGRCNRSVSTLTGLGLFLSFFLRIFHTPSYFFMIPTGTSFFPFYVSTILCHETERERRFFFAPFPAVMFTYFKFIKKPPPSVVFLIFFTVKIYCWRSKMSSADDLLKTLTSRHCWNAFLIIIEAFAEQSATGRGILF